MEQRTASLITPSWLHRLESSALSDCGPKCFKRVNEWDKTEIVITFIHEIAYPSNHNKL